MFQRLLITLAIAGAALAGYWVIQALQRRRAAEARRHEAAAFEGCEPKVRESCEPVLQAAPGRPQVLYFRSDHCTSCQTQARLFDSLDPSVRDLIEKIDVDREPERAEAYNVLSLPTVMVLDANGEVQHINYGVVPPRRLRTQLADAGLPIEVVAA
jgi:thiol-disulfide isomerase/thioredoxin